MSWMKHLGLTNTPDPEITKLQKRVEDLEWQVAWAVETVDKLVGDYNERLAPKQNTTYSIPTRHSDPKETTEHAGRRANRDTSERR